MCLRMGKIVIIGGGSKLSNISKVVPGDESEL